jgi:sterol desaturase/sphingolipid hydroxylase (fatty acid hydroxylase superfamily)
MYHGCTPFYNPSFDILFLTYPHLSAQQKKKKKKKKEKRKQRKKKKKKKKKEAIFSAAMYIQGTAVREQNLL